MNLKSLQSVAESYIAMLAPKAVASASKPKWVPASITEENVAAFVQAVTEARKANESVVEFNGKKYGIKSIKEDASAEDQGLAKKIQDVGTENAPKQPSDEVPAEVKEEDSEEIKGDNHDEKEVKADEMPKLDDPNVEEELSGNQHKLDLNKNGKVDGDDLKKLRGEEKEEDSDEKDGDEKDANHAEPDADDMGGESDNDADNEDEDEKEEEKPKMTGEQVMASLAAAYVKMNEGAPADAEAGPEVMDPATQKMKDDSDDETEIVDLLPTAAQDGADKLDSAEKPAPANKSEALPKVAIVDAPTKLGESVEVNEGAYVGGPEHAQAQWTGGINSKKSNEIRKHLIDKGHSFSDHSHVAANKQSNTHYISMNSKEGHEELQKIKKKHGLGHYPYGTPGHLSSQDHKGKAEKEDLPTHVKHDHSASYM